MGRASVEGTEPCATNPGPQRVGAVCQGGRGRQEPGVCRAARADLTGRKTLPRCTVPPRANRYISARRCCPMRPDACGFEPRRDDHLAIGDRTTGKPRRQRDGPVAAWKDTHLDFGAAGSIPARPAIVRGTGGMPTRGGYRTCRSCSTAARVNRAVEGAEWLP